MRNHCLDKVHELMESGRGGRSFRENFFDPKHLKSVMLVGEIPVKEVLATPSPEIFYYKMLVKYQPQPYEGAEASVEKWFQTEHLHPILSWLLTALVTFSSRWSLVSTQKSFKLFKLLSLVLTAENSPTEKVESSLNHLLTSVKIKSRS